MAYDETTSLIRARRPSVKQIQEEKEIQVPSWFNFFVQAMEWAPIWCFLLIDNATYAITAAFSVECFKLFLSYVQYKMGKFLYWPKPLDVVFLSVFGLLAILVWIYQDNAETIEIYIGAAINTGLALGFIVSWLIGRPVATGYQVDMMGHVKASHPIMLHQASWVTVMFAIAFSFAAVLTTLFPTSEWTFLICNLVIGSCFLTAYKLYPAYVTNHLDEFAALYDDEIAEWEAKHPEEIFFKESA